MAVEAFGLSDDELLVYRALLRAPFRSAAEVAGDTRLGSDVVHQAIATLAARGLLRSEPTTASGYALVRPDLVLRPELDARERDVAARAVAVKDAQTALSAAVEDYLVGRELLDPALDLERLDGLDAVRDRLDDVVGNAREELLSIVTEFDDSKAAVDAARDEDLAVLARGVRVRTIYPTTIRDMPVTWAYAMETAAAGEEIRLIEEGAARMIVVDRAVAVIPADPGDLDAGALVVRSPAVAAAFVALFELCWLRATPVFSGENGQSGSRAASLLGLLTAGAKDETIARHLSLNVRTVRRDIAELMAQLDAGTRFQAGVEAARRGLV